MKKINRHLTVTAKQKNDIIFLELNIMLSFFGGLKFQVCHFLV